MTTIPYEGQVETHTAQLNQYLSEFEQTGQPVEKLINHRIQRYNGRTSVHLAASNGLWESLEILLKNGGGLSPRISTLWARPLSLDLCIYTEIQRERA